MMRAPHGIPRAELIASLSRTIDKVLSPLLPAGEPCALLHFPSSANAGDNAIWLGETTYLRRAGARVVYACEVATYSRDRLAARLGQGTILLQGGGNLGDLWSAAERLREDVIAAFPDRPIIQLPQTIHFRDAPNLARVRTIFNRHPNLTLLVRDRRSLEFARNEFTASSLLCPDMAFALGPLRRPGRPRRAIVCLLRTDQESVGLAMNQELSALVRLDWRVDRPLPGLLTRGIRAATRLASRQPRALEWAWPTLTGSYGLIARLRVARGVRMLSPAACVVTDRLHGHILSLLLGIPHVVLDNSYGKVRSFYETWTAQSDLVDWADSPAEAMHLATALASHSMASGTTQGGIS